MGEDELIAELKVLAVEYGKALVELREDRIKLVEKKHEFEDTR